jgi:hypothetical protein
MPIYVEISRLYRCVTVVARGTISPEEILGTTQELVAADVPSFTKLVDVAGATADLTAGDIRRLGGVLRTAGKVKRGAVAFLIDPARSDFARAFAGTQRQRPVRLFTSIHQARDWLARGGEDGPATTEAPAGSPWSDPDREAVLIRRGQRRALQSPAVLGSYAAG